MAKGRKKKNIHIDIDTKFVDVKIDRVDGVTDVTVDTPIVDVEIHKEPELRPDIKIEMDGDGMLALALELLKKKHSK